MKAQNRVFRGTVRNVNYQDRTYICTFRLEQLDETGDISGYNVVEVFNILTDIAAEGDTVEIFGTLQNGTIHPKNIHNLTTGKTLKVSSRLFLIGLFPLLAIPLLAIGYITLSAFNISISLEGIALIPLRIIFPPKITNVKNCSLQLKGAWEPELYQRPKRSSQVVGSLSPEKSYPVSRIAKVTGIQGKPFTPHNETWYYTDVENLEGWIHYYEVNVTENCPY